MHRNYSLLILCAVGTVAVAVAIVDTKIPKTTFSCNSRSSGYYADVESGCQVYHMCDGLGRQFSYTCPNATLFQQRMLICDHWYMVNCSKSEDDYAANLRIGQREMPFVDDSESNPYHRTPRPDLLSHPSQSEYDIIYRTGKAYKGNNLNLVGVEFDSKNSTSTTDEPSYSLPSHWSTEYAPHFTTTTSKPSVDHKSGGFSNGKSELPSVNFMSAYKATTPVFPQTVDMTTESSDLKLLPPLPYYMSDNKTNVSDSASSEVPKNFESLFKATTPVYPTSVDITSEEPSDVGILPPVGPGAENLTQNASSLEIQPPAVSSQSSEESGHPSKYYQPPKVDDRKHGFKMLDNNEWADLRKKYLIPDYEFPLESVSRPSYDSLLSSFQVSGGPTENVIKVTADAV